MNAKLIIKNAISKLGYQISRLPPDSVGPGSELIELESEDISLINYVLRKKLTMTGIASLVNTIKSCKYVVQNNIVGDFVECGTWRGGHGIVAKKIFERLKSPKKVILFDTFTGMTKPSDADFNIITKDIAETKYKAKLRDAYTDWAYASLSDVKRNFEAARLDLRGINFIEGDVCKTLLRENNVPSAISVLRLDTDWYESTSIELKVLYPILQKQGVLIVDDYGSWDGSRKAVDDYFSVQSYKPLLNVVDRCVRSAIKC